MRACATTRRRGANVVSHTGPSSSTSAAYICVEEDHVPTLSSPSSTTPTMPSDGCTHDVCQRMSASPLLRAESLPHFLIHAWRCLAEEHGTAPSLREASESSSLTCDDVLEDESDGEHKLRAESTMLYRISRQVDDEDGDEDVAWAESPADDPDTPTLSASSDIIKNNNNNNSVVPLRDMLKEAIEGGYAHEDAVEAATHAAEDEVLNACLASVRRRLLHHRHALVRRSSIRRWPPISLPTRKQDEGNSYDLIAMEAATAPPPSSSSSSSKFTSTQEDAVTGMTEDELRGRQEHQQMIHHLQRLERGYVEHVQHITKLRNDALRHRRIDHLRELPQLVEDLHIYAATIAQLRQPTPTIASSPMSNTHHPVAFTSGSSNNNYGDGAQLLYLKYPPPMMRSTSFFDVAMRLMRWMHTWRGGATNNSNNKKDEVAPTSSSSSSTSHGTSTTMKGRKTKSSSSRVQAMDPNVSSTKVRTSSTLRVASPDVGISSDPLQMYRQRWRDAMSGKIRSSASSSTTTTSTSPDISTRKTKMLVPASSTEPSRLCQSLPFFKEMMCMQSDDVLGSSDGGYVDQYGNRLRSARLAKKEAEKMAVEAAEQQRRSKRKGYFSRDVLQAHEMSDDEDAQSPHDGRGKEHLSNSSSTDVDDDECSDDITNIAVVSGPTGSGKTAAVFLAAQLAGFRVVEMNASVKRCAKSVDVLLAELTRSHRLSTLQMGKKRVSVEAEISKLKKEHAAMVARREREEAAAASAAAKTAQDEKRRRGANAISAAAVAAFFKPKKAADNNNNNTCAAEEIISVEEEDAVVVDDTPATNHISPSTSPTTTTPSSSSSSDGMQTLLLIEDADVMLGEEAAKPFYAAIRDLALRSKVPLVATVSCSATYVDDRYDIAGGIDVEMEEEEVVGNAHASLVARNEMFSPRVECSSTESAQRVAMNAALAAHHFGKQTPFAELSGLTRTALMSQLLILGAVELKLIEQRQMCIHVATRVDEFGDGAPPRRRMRLSLVPDATTTTTTSSSSSSEMTWVVTDPSKFSSLATALRERLFGPLPTPHVVDDDDDDDAPPRHDWHALRRARAANISTTDVRFWISLLQVALIGEDATLTHQHNNSMVVGPASSLMDRVRSTASSSMQHQHVCSVEMSSMDLLRGRYLRSLHCTQLHCERQQMWEMQHLVEDITAEMQLHARTSPKSWASPTSPCADSPTSSRKRGRSSFLDANSNSATMMDGGSPSLITTHNNNNTSSSSSSSPIVVKHACESHCLDLLLPYGASQRMYVLGQHTHTLVEDERMSVSGAPRHVEMRYNDDVEMLLSPAPSSWNVRQPPAQLSPGGIAWASSTSSCAATREEHMLMMKMRWRRVRRGDAIKSCASHHNTSAAFADLVGHASLLLPPPN